MLRRMVQVAREVAAGIDFEHDDLTDDEVAGVMTADEFLDAIRDGRRIETGSM
jgi:hypothetical protein